jgi:hypothetical protein
MSRAPSWCSAVAILALLVASAEVLAEPDTQAYRSTFGFTATFPAAWMVLTRAQIQANANLFESMETNAGLEGADPNLLAGVSESIRRGEVEMAFRTPMDPVFADNVNVTVQAGQLPGQADLSSFCVQIVPVLSKYFGHPVGLHECALRQVGKRVALYMDFDGMAVGTQSLQYQIQKAPGSIVIVTATAAKERMAPLRRDFQTVIDSLAFGDAK